MRGQAHVRMLSTTGLRRPRTVAETGAFWRWMQMTFRRTTFHFAVIVLIAAALSACGQPGGSELPVILEPTLQPTAAVGLAFPSAPAPTAEAAEAGIIFYNGLILTMDDALPTASAIYIQGERIVSVGDDASLLAEAGPTTTLVDLAGRTMMPGFVDADSHYFGRRDFFPTADEAQDAALAQGITTTAEFYVDGVARRIEGPGSLRGAAHEVEHVSFVEQRVRRLTGRLVPGPSGRAHSGKKLWINRVKIFTDWGVCNVPAVSFEYPGGYGHGDPYFSVTELEFLIR